jgi:hypothetical protein
MENKVELASTLEGAWQAAFARIADSEVYNLSLAAFQLSKAVGTHHSDLCVSFNGLSPLSDLGRPNFVVWRPGEVPVIVFFATIIVHHDSAPAPKYLTEHLLRVIEKGCLEVLTTAPGESVHRFETISLSPQFEFGLFSISEPPRVGYPLRALWGPMTKDQLSRFHFAQIAPESPESQRPSCSYRSPPGLRGTRRGNELPDLSFTLKDGREVFVDGLVLEASASEKKLVTHEGIDALIVAEQPAIDPYPHFGDREFFYLESDLADADSPRLPNMVITAWLSSAPFNDTAIRSELVVMFYAE